MPVGSSDALKAIELLELYRSKLSEASDKNLIDAIDKVINVFNSQFFIALLDKSKEGFELIRTEIQRFYIDILSNNYLSVSDKTQETLNFLQSLKLYPSSPSSVASSGRVGSRLANDVESINMLYSSLRSKESLINSNSSNHKNLSNTFPYQSKHIGNKTPHDTNNLYTNNVMHQEIDNQLISRPIVMEAVIVKGSTGFGFSVAGGIDNPYFHSNDPGIYVTKITPGGSVDLNGSLNIDDQILSVNGINMTYLTHEAAVSALKEAGDELHLVIQRDPTLKTKMSGLGYMKRKNTSLTTSTMSDSRRNSQLEKSSSQASPDQLKTNSHNSIWISSSKASSIPSNLSHGIKSSNSSFVSLKSRIVTLTLVKGDRGLGFSIGGGRGNEHYVGDPGIYITKVTDKGAAAATGLIAEGDKLVQVNEHFLTDVTHEEAVKILCNVGSKVELKILKPACGATSNFPENYEEPFSQSIKDLSESMSNNDSSVKLNDSDNNHDLFFDEIDNNFMNKSPRIVILERPNEITGFGFNIVGGEDEDGIFVSFIIPNGIADKNGNIFVGDRIWQVNGIDISIATHDEAAVLLKGAGTTVELMLTTNINEYVEFESKFNWNSQKYKETSSNWFNSKSTPNLVETLNKQGYTEVAPVNNFQNMNKVNDHMRSVGCELDSELLKKDKVEVNGFHSSNMYKSCKSIDFLDDEGHNSKYNEERKTTLNDYESRISEKENHQIFTFESNTSTTNSATNHSGISNESGNICSDRESNTKKNGFYVRALFEFDPDVEKNLPSRPLAFLTNDIILVVNSADPDWWQARVVEDSNENGPLGIIPSPQKLYRKEKRHKKKVNFDSQLVSKNSKKNSLPRNSKPSFIKRMQFSGMSKSVQNIAEDKYNNDFMEEKFDEAKMMLYYYEPLVKISLDYIRPVVIIGPMRDKINDTLIEEHPKLFASCVPHTTRLKKPYEIHGKDYYFVKDRREMEEQIKHQEFIEAGQYKDNLYGTSVAAVRTVAKFKHCVLDVSALAIKRLVAANLLPITILIKPPSVKSLCNLSSKITVAQADSQVKKAEELQSKLSHYFTAVVWEDNFTALYNQIKSIIQCNSGSDIWVPTNQNTLTL